MDTLDEASRLQDTPELWEQHRGLIRQLYQGQDGHKQKLSDVRDILMKKHKFPSSPLSIYEARFRDLGLRKKMKKEDWLTVWLHYRKLQEDGKVPEVVLCGSRIPWVKAWKEIRRVKAHLVPCVLPLPPLPQGVTVHVKDTPVPHSPDPNIIRAHALHSALVTAPLRVIERSTQRAFAGSFITILSASELGKTQTPQSTVPMEDLATANVWKMWKTTLLSNLPCLQFLRSIQYTSSTKTGAVETTTSVDGLTLFLSRLSISSKPEEYDRYPTTLFRSHDESLQSKQALTLEVDPFHLLFKAVLRLSNNLVNTFPRLNPGDQVMIKLLFTRIPDSVLSLLARSELPSLRSAWKALFEIAASRPGREFLKMLDITPQEDVALMEIFVYGLYQVESPHILEEVIRRLPTHFATKSEITDVLHTALWNERWVCASILINWMSRACMGDQATRIVRNKIEDVLANQSDIEHVYLCMKTCQFSDDQVIDGLRSLAERARARAATPMPTELVALLSDLGQETLKAMTRYKETDGDCCHGSNPKQQRSQSACEEVRKKHADLYEFRSTIQSFAQESADTITMIGVYIALMYTGSLYPGRHERLNHQGLSSDLMDRAVERLCQFGPRDDVVEMIGLLLEHGAAICSKHLARVAEWGSCRQTDRLVALQTLQALGASIAVLGGHALVEAARRRDLSLVQWLLDAGVDINGSHPFGLEDDTELTIIGIAIYASSREELTPLTHFLVERGAILRWQPTDDSPIPWLANLIYSGKMPEPLSELFPFLENVCLAVPEAAELVTEAARRQHWELVEFLLGKGAPCTPDGLGVIVWLNGPADLIQRLIRDMADISTNGSPALRAVCRRLDLALCNQLLTLRVDIGLTDLYGQTALHYACDTKPLTESEAESQIRVVQSLLSAGADVNTSDCDGCTPLHWAALNGILELAILLLDNGADSNAIYTRGASRRDYRRYGLFESQASLDFAATNGRLDMVQLLLDSGAVSAQRKLTPFDGAILEACVSRNWEILQIILQHTRLSKDTLRNVILECRQFSVLLSEVDSALKTAKFSFAEFDHSVDEQDKDGVLFIESDCNMEECDTESRLS